MRYKFEHKYGRFWAYYKKHWWQRWKPWFTDSAYWSQGKPKQQRTYKNFKELFNDCQRELDKSKAIIIL